MTIIEQIKTEIERRIKELHEAEIDYREDQCDAIVSCLVSGISELQRVLSFLDTLESEKPMQEELEEEIDRFYGMYRKDGKTFDLTDNEQCVDWKMDCNPDFEIAFARHFYELGRNAK